ncbi:TPA: hypothetical protein VKH48_001229 [Streptococcus pyogenes]|nr:hypothetical protein [Streptococcus pyogenes]HER3876587.1 hypothetical protein [Streptococcus pyogenes]
MQEKELMHWLITVVFPVVITGASFYVASKNRTAELEHRLTELEVINRQQEKVIDSHNRRLDKHEEEQKITLALVERIDSLNRSIDDMKSDMSEIKDTIGKL